MKWKWSLIESEWRSSSREVIREIYCGDTEDGQQEFEQAEGGEKKKLKGQQKRVEMIKTRSIKKWKQRCIIV